MSLAPLVPEQPSTFRAVVDGSGRGRSDVTGWVSDTARQLALLPAHAADRLAHATWALLSRRRSRGEVLLAMRVDTGIVEIRFGSGPGEALLYRRG